jgi:uncharacterized Zn finger protein
VNVSDEYCPECDSGTKVELSRADQVDARGFVAVLYQCEECGTAWDAYVRPES